MPLGSTVTSLGSTAAALANTATVAHTTTAAVPSDATAVVVVGSTSAGRVLVSVTDDQGNTWRIDETAGASGNLNVASLYCPSGLPSGTVITATWASALNTQRQIHAAYVTGHGIADRTSRGGGGPSAAWTSGATLPTTVGGVAFGASSLVSNVNNTNTTGSSPAFTELIDTNGAATGFTVVSEYATSISAGSAVNAGGTWSVSNGSWDAIVVVYRDATDPLSDSAVWSLGGRGEGNVNTSTMTLTTKAEVPAGCTAVAVVVSGSSGRVLSSLTDSQGNTWTIDRVVGGSPSMHFVSCYVPRGLPYGTVLTATWASSIVAARAIHAGFVSGNRILDQSAINGATATAWSSSATAATTALGVAIGGACQNNAVANTNTTGSNPAFTELLDNVGGIGVVSTFAVDVPAGTAVTAAGTWGNVNPAWRAGVVVYKRVLGLAIEADTAGALTVRKTKAIGQATETDTARPITAIGGAAGGQTIAVGQALETDTAGSVSPAKVVHVAAATEADTARAIAAVHSATVAQATETDAARPVGVFKHGIGRAGETDTARPMLQPILRRALETDSAGLFVLPKFIPVTQAAETDTAGAVLDVVQLGRATETDTARALVVVWFPLIKQAVESDSAQVVVRRLVNRATETDTAGLVVRLLLHQAVETDTARPLTVILYLLPDVYDLTEPEDVVFQPTLVAGQLLDVDELATTVPTVFEPSLQAAQSVEPGFLVVVSTVFSPRLQSAQALEPAPGPTGAPTVFPPTLIRGQLLQPDIGSGLTPTVFDPSLAHGQELQVDTIPGPLTPTVFDPSLAHAQPIAPDTATGLLSPIVYSPSLAESQVLVVDERAEVDEAVVFEPSLQLREPSEITAGGAGQTVLTLVRTAV